MNDNIDSARLAIVSQAVDTSQTNALRLALYQLTRDPQLVNMRIERLPVRGGAQFQNVVAAESLPLLKEKVLAFLSKPLVQRPPPPDPVEARLLLEMFCERPLSENLIRFGLEELGFEAFPRDVHWSKSPSPQVLANLNVLVIGGGISGITAAIQLQRLGIRHQVIERQSAIGGTWQLNDFPEARVDTTSYMYQYKFEKNYPWSEYFASRAETKRYLQHIATKHGVAGSFRFNTEAVGAKWDEARALWVVSLRGVNGTTDQVTANFIISGSGLFATPKPPDIPGIERFRGRMFHSTQWDHSFDYAGKRVALIGNGSTGVQMMAHLARSAKQLTVYQRSANWIAGAPGYKSKVSAAARLLFDEIPYYWNWYCFASFDTSIQLQNSQTYDHEWRKTHSGVSEANEKVKANLVEYIKGQLGDRQDLIDKCMPDHPPLARRLVIDNGFYESLLRPNVELVTDRIECITESAVRSAGTEREFDLVILASGFKVTKYLWPLQYVGRNNITLDKAWGKDGARSYLGMTMPGFPNVLMMYGPNGQPRSGGFYSWAEVWARYICGLIVRVTEAGWRSAEVKREVFDEYNARLDAADKEILWRQEGPGSYFLNEFGRSAVNIAFRSEDYHAMVREPNLQDFDLH